MSIEVINADGTIVKENAQESVENLENDVKSEEKKEESEAPENEDETNLDDSEASKGKLDDGESEQDGESEDSEDEEESDEEPEEKPKKKTNGFRKRLNRERRKTQEARQEAEHWKQQATKNQSQEKKEEHDNPPNTKEGKPSPDDYETQEEYLEVLIDWEVGKRLEAQEKEQQQTKIAEEWQGKVSKFVEKFPDFEEVMEDAPDVKMNPSVTEAILTSRNGPAILYELAQDVEQAEKISKMSPLAGVMEIGKIEARLTNLPKNIFKEKKKTTKAPPPIGKKVSGGLSGSVKNIYDPGISQKDFEAMRNKQLANKGER